jgi:hypothetical protein
VISTRRILPPIKAVLNSAVKKHVFPGCVFGMVRKGDEASVLPIGRFTYENTSPRVRDNSIYDVASITKSIPVACLALKLIEDGHLNENDRLIQYVLEFTNPDRKEVHIKHLLTHTLNFGFRLSWYKDETPEKIMNIIFHSSFEDKPGEVFCYSNATSSASFLKEYAVNLWTRLRMKLSSDLSKWKGRAFDLWMNFTDQISYRQSSIPGGEGSYRERYTMRVTLRSKKPMANIVWAFLAFRGLRVSFQQYRISLIFSRCC